MVALSRLALAFAIAAAPLPALAQSETPTLTVFTYDAFAAEWGPGPGLKAGFEAQCACTLDFVVADSSIGALRRVQLEGAETEADIVLGLDTSIEAEARATGLFAPHEVDLSSLELPVEWTDPDFVPFDYGYFAFVYNTETVPSPPSSFPELVDLPEDFTIVIQDPRSATPGLGLVLWIKAAYGDEAADIWAGLAPHIVTVTRGWSESYDLFLGGEADMVLSYTTSPAYHIIAEEDSRFAAARFEEGHYLQVETAGILASSPDIDLARQFLAYLISPEAQAIIPETNWMFPVSPPAEPLHPAFAEMIDPDPVLTIDAETLGSDSRAFIEEALGQLD